MKEVVHQDTVYSPKTVQAITDLREERWAILSIMSTHKARQDGETYTAKEMTRFEKRLEVVHKELYKLTGNEIYNVR
jgi:hypothetical protein